MAIKLIFCTDGVFPHAVGGVQRHSQLLIEALAKTGEVKLLVIHPHQKQVFSGELGVHEVVVKGIDISKNYILESYRYSKRVYQVLEKYPDYIIYSQGFAVWHKIKEIGHRVIINPHGLDSYQSTVSFKDFLVGFAVRIIFNSLFKHCAKVISLGRGLTDILKDNIKDILKIAVIPNGINMPKDYQFFQRFQDNDSYLKVLFAGRFVNCKGINLLLKAVKELNQEGFSDKITFTLCGDGPLYNRYIRSFKYINIHYPGLVLGEQLSNLYKDSGLFILPSIAEGMSTVILEAMSYGLPIIATDAGAASELVNNENGYLIEKNSVRQIKNAIICFYNLSAEEKNRLSENSYHKVKDNFIWEHIVSKYIELFKSLKNHSCPN